MENCAYKTINAIYNDMKIEFNNNILFIKLKIYMKKIYLLYAKNKRTFKIFC